MSDFLSMDLGSGKATTIPMETVEVVISTPNMFGDYAKAFVKEAWRVNPLLAEQVQLNEEELEQYLNYLMTKHVENVNDCCSDFRRLKNLYIPSYFQFVMSTIGVCIDREFGIKLVPEMDEPSSLTYEDALVVSEKLGSFERDLQIVQDAMPRDIKGNLNVMGSALIAGYVRSYRRVEHPAATYVTAFANLKLKQEASLQALYRLRYDDVNFIQAALTTQKGLY